MATLRHQIATNVLTVTRFRELLKRLRSYRPNDDLELIRRAYNYSLLHHTGQQRASGEPYLVHPLDIYAPIAHRLGMGKIRGELEDLGFRYLDPIGYEQVHAAVESRRKAGEQFLATIEGILREKFKEAAIEAEVHTRIKRLYSIH